MSLGDDATRFNWMLNNFVKDTAGVTDAVAVSSDGLLMAMSNTLDTSGADQVAAIISGLVSLGEGTTGCLDFGELDQIIIAMRRGFLFVTAMGACGCLGVVTRPSAPMRTVGHQMTRFVDQAGAMLTPDLVSTLKDLMVTI